MRLSTALSYIVLAVPIAAQQIFDIYSTVWDRSKLFTYDNLGSTPVNFVNPGAKGDADIVINDGQTFQSIWGHGGSLTDSSALLLNNLKNSNPSDYWSLLGRLFDPTDGKDGAGLTFIRVPLGASDFSSAAYTFDDVSGDTSLSHFDINKAPSYLFSVLKDIKGINPYLRVHLTPWSPPGWMKDSGTINGGNFLSKYSSNFANYLLKSVQGFQNKGINIYSLAIQNEPENNNPTYPTCKLSASQEAQIGITLRSLLDSNGLSNVKLIGFDHNWLDAGGYPVQLMQQAPDAFAGVSFHCYEGNVEQQDTFHNAFPKKEIYFTECTGGIGSDWWSDIKWYMDHLYIGAIEHNAKTALMWNIALDGNGQPKYPGASSCGDKPCRGIVTISGSSYTINQQFYAMAQASKAILPRDKNGPWGKRLGVSIGGSLNWALRVTAFVTGRNNPSDWQRYSIVVLNWDDSSSSSWNPKPVKTTIEFRGKQATYTFPVGVTTLWWYAPASGNVAKLASDTLNTTIPLNGTSNEPTPLVLNGTASPASIPQYSASLSWDSSSETSSSSTQTSLLDGSTTTSTVSPSSATNLKAGHAIRKIRGARWW